MTALIARRLAADAVCASCGDAWPAEFEQAARARLRSNPSLAHDASACWVFVCPLCVKAGRCACCNGAHKPVSGIGTGGVLKSVQR